LYYWEIDFQNDVPNTIEKIITTNFGLGQPEAAKGILKSAIKNNMIDESDYETAAWLEKRHEWSLALQDYSEKLL
jgi:hypothetical protein